MVPTGQRQKIGLPAEQSQVRIRNEKQDKEVLRYMPTEPEQGMRSTSWHQGIVSNGYPIIACRDPDPQ